MNTDGRKSEIRNPLGLTSLACYAGVTPKLMKMNRYSILLMSFLVCGGFIAGQFASSAPSPTQQELPQERVTGIGGVFFKVRDPKAMAAWYRDHLGIDAKHGYADFSWREKDHPDQVGRTVWCLFPTNTPYFGSSSAPFMINYRVANLDRMLEQLRHSGVAVGKVEVEANGRFAWIADPEGVRIELWEPKEK